MKKSCILSLFLLMNIINGRAVTEPLKEGCLSSEVFVIGSRKLVEDLTKIRGKKIYGKEAGFRGIKGDFLKAANGKQFLYVNIAGDGDCCFHALGISRIEMLNKIADYIQKNDAIVDEQKKKVADHDKETLRSKDYEYISGFLNADIENTEFIAKHKNSIRNDRIKKFFEISDELKKYKRQSGPIDNIAYPKDSNGIILDSKNLDKNTLVNQFKNDDVLSNLFVKISDYFNTYLNNDDPSIHNFQALKEGIEQLTNEINLLKKSENIDALIEEKMKGQSVSPGNIWSEYWTTVRTKTIGGILDKFTNLNGKLMENISAFKGKDLSEQLEKIKKYIENYSSNDQELIKSVNDIFKKLTAVQDSVKDGNFDNIDWNKLPDEINLLFNLLKTNDSPDTILYNHFLVNQGSTMENGEFSQMDTKGKINFIKTYYKSRWFDPAGIAIIADQLGLKFKLYETSSNGKYIIKAESPNGNLKDNIPLRHIIRVGQAHYDLLVPVVPDI